MLDENLIELIEAKRNKKCYRYNCRGGRSVVVVSPFRRLPAGQVVKLIHNLLPR